MGLDGTRGILNPIDGFAHFSLSREPPPADLVPWVDGFWTVRWNLDGNTPFAQEILPYPCVNVSTGSLGFEVHGPGTKRFVAQLSGKASVLGMRFSPAGFFAFAHVPMRSLVDRVVSLEAATGQTVPVPPREDPREARAMIEAFVRAVVPHADEQVPFVNQLVARTQSDRAIATADDLARVAGMSVRSLHRVFERYVGVGPKWIVRRSRVQEAAERVARGERVDWAETAQELGYHDQAHLIHDFRAQVGFTPAAYARRCAAATSSQTSRGDEA